MFYGIFLELIQIIIPGRYASLEDVLLNALCICVAILFIYARVLINANKLTQALGILNKL